MKTIPTAVLVLSGVVVAGACGAQHPPSHASTTLAARITAAEAVPQIAAARCDKETRCQTEAADSKSVERCRISQERDIDKDFGENPDCANGIAPSELDNCIAHLHSITCGAFGTLTEGIQTSTACSSGHLCLR
jgi:hypothetical protein